MRNIFDRLVMWHNIRRVIGYRWAGMTLWVCPDL